MKLSRDYKENEILSAPHAKSAVFYKHGKNVFSLVATDDEGQIIAVCRYSKEDWLNITGKLLQNFAGPSSPERVC
jgi:hypothetical protein